MVATQVSPNSATTHWPITAAFLVEAGKGQARGSGT